MKFTGVLPALVTPLTKDEKINVPVLEKLLSGLLAQGADGFYIGGATGEGISLPATERMILAEASVNAVGHKKPCIVHIASTDFNEALELARYFGEEESVGFINGVLGKYALGVEKPNAKPRPLSAETEEAEEVSTDTAVEE